MLGKPSNYESDSKSIDVESIRNEIQLVVDFINQHLTKTSIVYHTVLDATTKLSSSLVRNDTTINGGRDLTTIKDHTTMQVDEADMITLKVLVNPTNYAYTISDASNIIEVQVTPSESISVFSKSLEDLVFGQLRFAVTVDRLRVRRTGKVWSSSSTKTLHECEIIHLDEIIVDCRSCIDIEELSPISDPLLQRMNLFNIVPSTPLELLSLALHSFMIDKGFIPVVELPNTVPGFAPSIKGDIL